MIIPREQVKFKKWDNCHGGQGRLLCVEMLDTNSREPGFTYVADLIVEPGASIGEHEHKDDEEIYFILDGDGEMLIDGVKQPVRAGDLVYTKKGHRHALVAGLNRPMRIVVAAANV